MVMVKVDFFLILRNSTCSFLSQASIRSRINWRLEGFFYFLFVLGDLLTHTHETATDKGGSHRRSRILKNPVNEINFCFVFVIRESFSSILGFWVSQCMYIWTRQHFTYE